jgi:hypothetical protein
MYILGVEGLDKSFGFIVLSFFICKMDIRVHILPDTGNQLGALIVLSWLMFFCLPGFLQGLCGK